MQCPKCESTEDPIVLASADSFTSYFKCVECEQTTESRLWR